MIENSGSVSPDPTQGMGQMLGPGGIQPNLGPGGTQDIVPLMPANASMDDLKAYLISYYGEDQGGKLYNMFVNNMLMAMNSAIHGAAQASIQSQKEAAQGN
jgi:hypothetical protein